jgi:hypothetical protein
MSTISDKHHSDQQKLGLAIVTACLVDTLDEGDPTFKAKFLERVALARDKVQNDSQFNFQYQTELLMRVENFLKGWSDATGQGKTFL